MGISFANIDIGGLFSGIGTLAKDIRAAITGKEPIDATKAAELELKLLELEQSASNAQTEINKLEAASTSLFVSGWRPAVGWTGVIGLNYQFIINPVLSWASTNFQWIAPPVIDTSVLIQLIMALLGVGGMRTYEKVKGVARS